MRESLYIDDMDKMNSCLYFGEGNERTFTGLYR